ncbi:MAG TPA: hypothetical protein VN958_01355, partial [Chitinophagaceae bacterium]|nr:hypothetical protein [Chitinophagaceae bacterium]
SCVNGAWVCYFIDRVGFRGLVIKICVFLVFIIIIFIVNLFIASASAIEIFPRPLILPGATKTRCYVACSIEQTDLLKY